MANRFSIASISQFQSRPSSSRFRPTSILTPKPLDNLMSRPVTAKNSIHTWNNVGYSSGKKQLQYHSKRRLQRAIEKQSDSKSIFATDLRFVLEQENIKKMNIQIDKIFCKNKPQKILRPQSGVNRIPQKTKKTKSRPLSAYYHQRSQSQSQKNNTTKIDSNKQQIENKQNIEKQLNKEFKLNEQQIIYEQLLKNRFQSQKFIKQHSNYQDLKYASNNSYPDVQTLGQQYIQNDLELVQKPIYQPKKISRIQDLSYFSEMVSKIDSIETNIRQIMTRPRNYQY